MREVLSTTIQELDGSELMWNEAEDFQAEVGILRASKNGWSRSARRKGKGSAMVLEGDPAPAGDPTPSVEQAGLLLEATVSVRLEGEQVKVEAEWTQGFDGARKDWTTLWAYLIRRLVDRAKETGP